MKAADVLNNIYLPDKVGKGYGTMWRSKCRYVAVKGSRRSKKSKTQAMKLIYQIIKYPLSHALVVRRYYNTMKDSCFKELKWAARNLGVYDKFTFKESPLEITFNETGQQIYFRGLDDPLKITSVTVEFGALCWLWIEEAFEIEEEKDFDMLNESMMGSLPDGYYRQTTITFNPWSEGTWIKARFFDKEDPNVLAMTTNYLCNEWLSEEDMREFEEMKRTRPERYKVAGLGGWGVDGCVYYEEFDKSVHVVTPFPIPAHWRKYRSIDYGLDALAGLYYAIDTIGDVYVVSEVYQPGLVVSDACAALIDGNPFQERDMITYAPPDLWSRTKDSGKQVSELFYENGVPLVSSSNARIAGWMEIHERLKVIERRAEDGEITKTARIHIFSCCKNLIRTLSTIKADEKNINDVATEPHELTHLPDSLRYFCVQHTVPAVEPKMETEADRLADYRSRRLGRKSGIKVYR